MAAVLSVAVSNTGRAEFPVPAAGDVAFTLSAEGFVSPKFHPRRQGNRVLYASSLKQAHRWLRFTRYYWTTSNFSRLNYRRHALLAILFKESPGMRPGVASITERDRTLRVRLNLYPLCPPFPYAGSCPASLWSGGESSTCWPDGTCGEAWGLFVILRLDKQTLTAPPKRINVTESQRK
jgi:hypothetical protein